MRYALVGARVYTGDRILDNHAVVVENGLIHAVCLVSQIAPAIRRYQLPAKSILTPGFIDLQLNGCGGVMFNDGPENLTLKTLEKMHQTNLLSGCTSFLPTLITCSDEDMRLGVQVVGEYLKYAPHAVLGLHLEGPYINPEKRGTHNPHYIRAPDQDMVDFLCAHSHVIRKLTLAPEVVAPKWIQRLKAAGIVVSCGHTQATYEEASAGFDAGIRCVTHLYNAMPALSGRAPGVIGAAFDRPEIYCCLIADGYHVNWSNIRLAWREKGCRLVLVTDATAAASSDIQSFLFAGKTVQVENGRCLDQNGVLSGSALTMIQAVQNCVEYVGIPLDEALRMASLYPAQVIGESQRMGRIAPGYIANLVALSPGFEVLATASHGYLSSEAIKLGSVGAVSPAMT